MTMTSTPDRNSLSPAKSRCGFSLLELLIVVAIILIIATIAIPSLMRSRQAANESAAVGTLRLISGAQNIYQISYKRFGTIGQLIDTGLLDDRFSSPKSGYQYAVTVMPGDFTASANAVSENSGRYDYYTSQDFVVRYSTEATRAPAGQAGQPVQ